MEQRIFDKKNVILTRITESDLESFLVDSDIDDEGNTVFRFTEFANAIIETIPEYVFANYQNPDIPQTDAVERLREAAKSIYRIKEYDLMRKACLENDAEAQTEVDALLHRKRGEFGELLLHLLLRDFHGTIPLVSKAYFKDATGVAAHGFDAVHISQAEKILWLGESKFYGDGKKGVKALIKDITTHFCKDYLNEQILIIKKNLECNEIPQRDEWIDVLNSSTKLSDQIDMINIPLLCTYHNEIYNLYNDLNCDEAITYHETNIRDIKAYFDAKNNHPLKDRLNILLILFPVHDKTALVRMLHEKLWHMQSM
ncbi:MAG: DUF1837 domain-containing protein [Oscillospiraceae bacterium]|nr:DUF1837 domain-containing protein [Oscillospiraceae bacterium]